MNKSKPTVSASPPPAVPAVALSKSAIFWRGLTSTTILWAVVIGVLFAPRPFSDVIFLLSVLIITGLGLNEFFQLVQRRDVVCFKGLGILGGLVLSGGLFACLYSVSADSEAKAHRFETIFFIVFLLAVCLRQLFSKNSATAMLAISTTLLGVFYVVWLLGFLQKINYFPFPEPIIGHMYLLYFLAVTKFSDLGAYVTGSLLGRHKMIPRISPGKTWEGFAGAIAVSTLISVLFVWLGGERLTGLTYGHAVVLGVLLGAAAVAGDLVESLFKREAGVKDSGRFFPGIGGMLDLMDSLLFNAPIMYLYLRHVLMPV